MLQEQVHLNALANSSIETELVASKVLPSTPSDAVTMSTPQASPSSELQCFIQELEDERAHSGELQEQVRHNNPMLSGKGLKHVPCKAELG